MAGPPTELVNPFLTYNFRVKWDGRYVAAVTSVSGLTRRTAAPGQTDYEPVRLQRGITTDTAFQNWANLVWYEPNTPQPGGEIWWANVRKPMQIELCDQAGIVAVRYNLYQCWPSEYTALPNLNSEENVVTLASMTIQHEGWDRDMSVNYPPGSTTQP
jgi:phage tail-like protein